MARSAKLLVLSGALVTAACMGSVDDGALGSEEGQLPAESSAQAQGDDAVNASEETPEEEGLLPLYAVTGCPGTAATNAEHVSAGRATTRVTSFFFFKTTTYLAAGTAENLGTSATTRTTLFQIAAGSYSKSESNCPKPPVDAGTPDAGPKTDAGTPTDAGTGTPIDAGTPADAGTPSDAGTGTTAGPRVLPKPTQACPTLQEGVVSVLGRKVTLWMGNDGVSKLGPVVVYWHATGSSPSEVMSGLGSAAVQEIKNQGGIVIAMNAYDGASSGGSTTGNNVWYTGDFNVTDEVIACAIQNGVGIDTKRIHTTGFSAGALQASYMVRSRSNYLASATSYSGGAAFGAGAAQDATNKVPVIFFHGGANDTVGINFKDASTTMANQLKSAGHYVVMCDHGGGHRIPSAGAATTWRFFLDHGYKQSPEAYTGGLPSTFPSYCKPF